MKRFSMTSLLLISLFRAATAGAAPGDLDVAFSGDGILVQDLGTDSDLVASAVVQADGKLVVAGSTGVPLKEDFLVARYLDDGSFDDSFGSGGIVTVDFAGGSDSVKSMVLQPDGKIVVGGFVESAAGQFDFGLVRFDAVGDLDADFGTSGRVVTDFGKAFDVLGALAFDDGKIIAAGSTANSSSFADRDAALARYRPDGTLDTAFDGDGTVVTDLGALGSTVAGVSVQADGKVVASGFSATAVPTLDGLLLRYQTDGSLDPSFDDDGILSTELGSAAANFGQVAVQPDGRIVAVGRISQAVTGNDLLVARFESDGSPDATFGAGGRSFIDVEGLKGSDVARSLALQADGKILIGGETTLGGTTSHFIVARLKEDGAFDTSFGGDGIVTTPLGVSGAQLPDLALYADGRIVAAGLASEGPLFDVALVRYLGDAADLNIALVSDSTSALPGDALTFTVTVSNDGPDAAGGVTVTADLPEELVLDESSIVASQGECSLGEALVCDLGILASGAGASVVFEASADGDGELTIAADVTAQAADANTEDNAASVMLSIAAPATSGGCSLHRHP